MKNIHAGDKSLVREINLSAVLDQLQGQAPVSRAQLALLTGLNKSTISSLIDELIETGLVIENGLMTSLAGRPGKLLELNPNAGCGIGMEIGVDFILVVVSDFVGNILWRINEPIQTDAGQDAILERTFILIDEARIAALSFNTRLLGIGLTVPGMVDIKTGFLIFSPNLGWRNVPLKEMYTKRTGLPVFVDNDATAAALGEHLFGNARKLRDFIFVLVGIGIGCGMFLDGKIYRGTGGMAGEIGHTILGAEVNRPCRCGHRGCWETYGNQYALIERMHARLDIGLRSMVTEYMVEENQTLSIKLISRAADAGDPVALDVFAETGNAIGLGIANLVDIFNPEMVVIGGGISIAGEYLLPSIKTVVQERALPEAQKQTSLVLTKFGTDAVVMGAVGIVVKAILSNPLKVQI